ncbi:hypothetical protein FPV67DRAFT_1448607 [Lyophyllum atratum]|nr:hypothetical protein FPV67DRAFT_1448607 [Lyophyllum atratum]
MPGPKWTTDAQYEFLNSRLKDYLDVKEEKVPDYTNFWGALYTDWAAEYPENLAVFPDKSVSDFTPEEHDQLKGAIKARRQQLQTWYRWRGSARGRGAVAQSKVLGNLFTTSRLPQKAEIYSKLYYQSKIADVVKEEAKRLNIKGRGEILKLRSRLTREMCEAETDEEVLAKVEEHLADLIAQRGLAPEPHQRSTDEYMEAIEDCPRVLNRFFNALAEKTGWAFSVLMGGPDPSRDGDITVASFHAGEDGFDNNFSAAHPNFHKEYMQPFTDYLSQVYSPAVRRSRSSNAEVQADDGRMDGVGVETEMELFTKSDVDILQSTVDALLTLKSSGSGYCASKGDASTGSTTSAAPVTPSPSHPALTTAATSTIPSIPVTTPPSSAALATTAVSPVASIPVTPPSDQDGTAPPEPVTDPIPIHSTSLTDPPLGPLSPSDHPAYPFSTPPAPTPNAATADITQVYGGNDMSFLNQDQDLLSALLDSLSGNGEGASVGPDNFQFTPQFDADFSWMVPFNMPGYDASGLIPQASSTLPGLSGAFDPYADITMSNLGIPTLPDLSHNTALPLLPLGLPPSPCPSLPDLTARPSSHSNASETPSNPKPVITNAPQLAPLTGTPRTSANHALPNASATLSNPTPVITSAPQFALLTPSASGNHATPDASSSKQARSRSGRQIIPSTRAEAMNKIGSVQTLSLDSANKENIPPGTGQERPAWAVAAEAHLTTRDLGDGWTKCVSAWKAFEDAMGPNAKGALPSAKTRPEEWTKWVAKGRQGIRAYNATPTIQDPLDFGYAVMAWWKSMQPAFRQSSELMPKPVYDPPMLDVSNVDEWAALRKGGPNGLVSVLTVLVWWGQCLKSGSQWQENSEPYWRACVDDVHQCLGKLMPSASSQKRTRGAKDDASGSSKR